MMCVTPLIWLICWGWAGCRKVSRASPTVRVPAFGWIVEPLKF